MRLGQLSRQLEVSSDQIAKLLNENFREVSSHPNVKLTEEELEFVQNHFHVEEETIEDSTPEVDSSSDIKSVSEVEKEEPSLKNEEPDLPEFVESLRPQVITLEEEFLSQTEDLETFKAEKPHLEGLKVVGKIELPEPIVKEKPVKPEASEDRKPKERRNNHRRSEKRPQKNRGNSVVDERKKAERLAKKRKFEEEQRLKELKKKHYEETVKAKIVQPSPKKKKKAVEVSIDQNQKVTSVKQPVKSTPKAKNPVKRFWLWLNGAYDN